MKLVAIGGGENGRPGTKYETRKIDEEIVTLAGKKHPKLLFIPPPGQFQEAYFNVMNNVFSKFGCRVSPLYLTNSKPNKKLLESTILGSDIIYVGGGNTLSMLKYWRKHSIDKILMNAVKNNIVLSGLSAGAICWFKYGNSDSMTFTNSKADLIRIKGLGLIDFMVCPHYDERVRRTSLRRMIKNRGGRAIALESCSAIEVFGDKYRIITSKKGVHAYLLYREKGRVVEMKVPILKMYNSLEQLFKK